MVKTLQRHGNSLALTLEKPLLELLNINANTQLQITVSGGSLIVTPIHVCVAPEEVVSVLGKLRPRYKKMIENLAV